MLTFIHAADFHLDSPFRELSPEQALLRRSEQRALLRRLSDLARAQNAQLVLLSGDLLDHNGLYRETVYALSASLRQFPCRVFIAPGNHDPASGDSPYSCLTWPPNVYIFRHEEVDCVHLPELNCVVHGAAFTSSDREDNPLAEFAVPEDGRIHLMALHGDVGGRHYSPVSLDSIGRSGLNYLALGHVHTFSGLQKAGGTYWAYPGCPEGRGFDECGEKGVIVGKVDDSGYVSIEFVPLCARRYEQMDVPVHGPGGPLLAAQLALEGHEQDICRLTFVGETEVPPDLPFLEQALAGRCFALTLRERTTILHNLWDRASEDGLTGLFLREMRERLEDAQNPEQRAMLELAVRFGLSALEQGEDCRP